MSNFTKKTEEEFKSFWDKMEDPLHVNNTKDWYDKYYEEWKFLLKNRKHIIDAGCGTGQFIKLMQKDFEYITGIDYSESMLKKADNLLTEEEKIKTKLIHGSIKDIKKLVDGTKADSIISNQVIQYLNHGDAFKFVRDSLSCLNEDGELILMNIPNFNLKELYNIRLYKRREKISYKMLIKEIANFHWTIFKQKVKNKNYEFNDGIGNWFLISEFEDWAKELNSKIEVFYSIYVPFGYRFHVRITK